MQHNVDNTKPKGFENLYSSLKPENAEGCVIMLPSRYDVKSSPQFYQNTNRFGTAPLFKHSNAETFLHGKLMTRDVT